MSYNVSLRLKKQLTDWETIFRNNMPEKTLNPGSIKKSQHMVTKKQQLKKWPKYMNRHFVN